VRGRDLNGNSETITNLTLTANSTIDFSGVSGTFTINNLDLGGFTLTIHNWDGSLNGGGAEQFIVNGSITNGTLADDIQFYSDTGGTPLGNGAGDWSTQLGSNEVLPTSVPVVPEPSTWLWGGGLIVIVVWHVWRRRSQRPALGDLNSRK